MNTQQAHHSVASRRHVILGLGALAAAPAAVTVATSVDPAPADATADAAVGRPECLADLVASGEVSRADFMVG